ncbi:MAG: DUF6391 domain-containing protein [Chloroflexota bacterium]|jgi:hypothetical protein
MLNETLSRIRRNHGLEHATIHVLTQNNGEFNAQGNSDHRGFSLNVYGDVSEADVKKAVQEAYKRMKGGEHQLAVHPNCGTVLLTTATLATLAGQAVFGLEMKRNGRNKLDLATLLNTLPTAVLAVVVAIILSRPFGIYLQATYTTEGDLGQMQIRSIRQVNPSPVTRLFQLLLTGNNPNLQARSYRIETVG